MQLQVSSLYNSAVTFTHQFLGCQITTQGHVDLKSYNADTIEKETRNESEGSSMNKTIWVRIQEQLVVQDIYSESGLSRLTHDEGLILKMER